MDGSDPKGEWCWQCKNIVSAILGFSRNRKNIMKTLDKLKNRK